MTTTTITLERSAYERLKAHKRSKESFSSTVLRMLDPDRPSLRGFLELFSEEDAEAIGEVVERLKAEDLATERIRLGKGGSRRGHRN
ncbi:MAG: antitoxin VapB family protein [Thermoplasmata archaeon]